MGRFRFLGLTALLGASGFFFAEGTAAATATFTVTKNVYNGPEWWGTITIKNNGPTTATSFVVEFDIPSGYHCTAEPESVPPGATLSPLAGVSSPDHTVSNHCVFTWPSKTLAPGQSLTFNYSTDTQNFSAASNVTVTDTTEGDQVCNTFSVTKNVYDGPEWWGTIRFKNNGPQPSSNYVVEFDVPSGVHCTNDYVPPGAVLSPLNGTGSSARTVSNHCVFTWTNASPLAVGSSKTFNYSTDSQSFSKANNVTVSDPSTCEEPACIPNNEGPCQIGNPQACCSNFCLCLPPIGQPGPDVCVCAG